MFRDYRFRFVCAFVVLTRKFNNFGPEEIAQIQIMVTNRRLLLFRFENSVFF